MADLCAACTRLGLWLVVPGVLGWQRGGDGGMGWTAGGLGLVFVFFFQVALGGCVVVFGPNRGGGCWM